MDSKTLEILRWKHNVLTMKNYPKDLWKLACKENLEFIPLPNHPPVGFARRMRIKSINFLASFGVNIEERQGKVFIGEVLVDGSYIG